MKELSIKQHEVLNRAIAIFGKNDRIDKIIEECTELSLALQHLKNKNINSERIYAVCDEIADVTIMLNQAIKIFNEPYQSKLINDRIDYKIDRLEKKLNNIVL
jgi:hypothetical protein